MPDLDPTFARHLAHSSDAELAAYFAAIGYSEIHAARGTFHRRIISEPSESTPRLLQHLTPFFIRLTRCNGEVYNLSDCATSLAFLKSPTDSQEIWFDLCREHIRILADSTLAPKARIAKQIALIDRLKPWSGLRSHDQLYYDLALSYARLGNSEQVEASLRLAAEEAQRSGAWASAAYHWTSLAIAPSLEVPSDSALVYFQRAIDLAQRVRDPGACGRAHSFLASYYMRRGELAAMRAEDDRAIAVSRDFKGPADEMRFLIDQMQRYAILECWTFVERHLTRAYALGEVPTGPLRHPDLFPFLAMARALEARLAFARGRVDFGEALFDSLDVMTGAKDPVGSARSLLERSRGLIDNARYESALTHLQRARALVETRNVGEYSQPLAALESRATFLLGRDDECRIALDHLRDATKGDLASLSATTLRFRLIGDGIRARLCSRTMRHEETREALLEGLDTFIAMAHRLDPDLQSHLYAEAAEDLHAALHEMIGDDARSGYAIELLWKQGKRAIGMQPTHPASRRWTRATMELRRIVNAPTADARRAAAHSLVARWGNNLASENATHCAFWDDESRIRRWIANGDSVTVDVLPVAPREIRTRIDHLLGSMGTQPAFHREDAKLLASLASDLLPPSILNRNPTPSPPLLLISADRSLARIPFDVLSVSASRYIPVGGAWDVAWLTGLPEKPRRPSVRSTNLGALVLADARPSPEVLRRFAEGVGLPLAIDEAVLAARLVPGSRLRTGIDASARTLFDSWENARYIYIAAHVIRDPEIPFISFIPLGTTGNDSSLAESTLDDPQIRRADLSRCELVVLSGCGSGAPFVDLSTDVASLGESFLDAGAHAVVHTQWAVRDDEASRLMRSFVRLWRKQGLSPIQALNAAKRDAASTDSSAHFLAPASWGAFSIALNDWP